MREQKKKKGKHGNTKINIVNFNQYSVLDTSRISLGKSSIYLPSLG